MLFLLVVFLYILSIIIIHIKFFNENLISYLTDKKVFNIIDDEAEIIQETETFVNQTNDTSSMMNGMTEFMKKDVEKEMTDDILEDCINNELESYLDEINVTPSESYDFKPVPTSNEVSSDEANLLKNIQGSNSNINTSVPSTDSSVPSIQAYDDFGSSFSTF